MSGGSGVNDQRFGVTDVSHQREELERVDQFLPCIVATLDSKRKERRLASGKILLCAGIVPARLKAGVVDPLHAGMLLKMLRHCEGILGMAFHAEMESFETLQEEEGAVRGERSAGVAQALDARLE